MNIILLEDPDFVGPTRAVISGRRVEHLTRVLRVAVGDQIRIGRLNGALGTATLVELGERAALECELHDPPPPRSPVDLILALPRPKMLRRILPAVASLGVDRVMLVGSYRVEKSYFQSPVMEADAIRAQLMLGLEQAGDTRLPQVEVHRFFKPFMEDVLPAAFKEHQRLLAHPRNSRGLPSIGRAKVAVALGPEGGWTEYETRTLESAGFALWDLGPRILRVDTAVTCAIARVESAHPLVAQPVGSAP